MPSAMMPTTQFELRLASRMSRLGTETAFEVLNRARALEKQGKEIIHLEIGEPDFDTPANIVEAAVDALHKGWTHYGPSAGLPDLRQTIAEYVSRTRNVPVSSDEVVVVPGGKPIIFFTMLALVDEGDEVIYPNPGFPIYESMINYVGGRAVPIPLREERDFSRRCQRAGLADHRPHQADHPEFAAQPDRRRAHQERHPRHRRRHRRPQHHGSVGRNLQPPDLRRRRLLHHERARLQGAHHSARRLLQNLRHDRMAHGLRRNARRSGGAHRAPR